MSWNFSLGITQNIAVEVNVHSVNLNSGKGVNNWVLFSWDVMDGAAALRHCREMMSLSGRPVILDSREGMPKGLVVGADGERNAF